MDAPEAPGAPEETPTGAEDPADDAAAVSDEVRLADKVAVSSEKNLFSALETDRDAGAMAADRAGEGKRAIEETGPAVEARGSEHWREQIERWQAVIDAVPDKEELSRAHLSLAASWYHLALSTAGREDLSAALEAHRRALDFVAQDSIKQDLREKMQILEDRLENRLEKK
jgi:hypothetical protein